MMKSIQISLLAALLLTAIAAEGAKHALLKQDWYLLESEHFSFMSNLKAEPAESMLRDLEQFRRVVLAITRLGEVEEPIGTRAIVFAKASQFNKVAYKNNIVGYMRPSFRGNRMVTSGDTLAMDQRLVMFHEYVHHLVRIASDRNYPTWYDEGLADTLATVYVENGKLIIGATSEVRVNGLANNPYGVGLSRIVHEDNLNRFHPYVASYFYSMSWALVNYLHTGHLAGMPNRLGQLTTYLDLLSKQTDREEAFEQAFGITPRAMEREMFDYLKKKRRPVLSFPAEQFAYTGKIERRVMTDEEVALELAFQTMFSKQKTAHKLLDSVLEQDPDNPYLLSAKGVAYQMQDKFVEGEALVRKAHALKPDDATLAIDYADLLVFWSLHECEKEVTTECKKRYERAKAIYVAALESSPQNPELRSAYGWLLMDQFEAYEEALAHMTYALSFQRWNPIMHLRVGLAHKGLQQTEPAIKHLEKALYWTENSKIRSEASDALVELGVMTAEEAEAQ